MRTATTLTRPQHRLSAYAAGTETTPAPPHAVNETACAEHLLIDPSPESVICMTSCYPPTPEELARYYALPLQRALIDFDLNDPLCQVIGSDAVVLSAMPIVPVKSMVLPWAVVTIVAHAPEVQDVADMLASRLDFISVIRDHAEGYFENGVMDFAMNALTEQQQRNIERNVGR